MTHETSSPGSVEKSEGVMADLKASSAEVGHKAYKKVEQVRSSAADGLDSAASAVSSGGERVASAARGAASGLSSSARYVREHETAEMLADVWEGVKSNPGVAMLGAAALGFLVGRALPRR